MRTRLFSGAAILLAAAAVCHAAPPCAKATKAAKASACCSDAAPCLQPPATAPVTFTTSNVPTCQVVGTPAVAFTVAAPLLKQSNAYDLLEKLEALRAKQDALESEIRETQALLNEKLKTLQARAAKAGAGDAPPVVSEVPAAQGRRYYEPVTSYQTVLVKDPASGAVSRVVRAVTSYVLREAAGDPLLVPPAADCPAPTPQPAPAPK